jgi:hypothetical protein
MTDGLDPRDGGEREERAFREALTARSEAANPMALDTDVVRHKARNRSRTKIGGAALAVLLVAGGVVGGVELANGNSSGDHAATLPEPRDGWRWEFYRDIRIQVPDDWGYDTEPGSDWCIGGGKWLPDQPYVDINSQGMATAGIGCPSPDGHGLSNHPPTSLWAPHVKISPGSSDDETRQDDDWWIVERSVGEASVRVVSNDRSLAADIAGSAEQVTDDSSGCAPHSAIEDTPFPSPDPAFDVGQLSGVDSITVCQYDIADWSSPGLSAISTLTGDAANEELAALKSAPTGGGPDQPRNCGKNDPGDSAIELLIHSGDDVHSMYVFYSSCIGNGFDDGTSIRELTMDACQPLIRPPLQIWSGSSASFERCVAP